MPRSQGGGGYCCQVLGIQSSVLDDVYQGINLRKLNRPPRSHHYTWCVLLAGSVDLVTSLIFPISDDEHAKEFLQDLGKYLMTAKHGINPDNVLLGGNSSIGDPDGAEGGDCGSTTPTRRRIGRTKNSSRKTHQDFIPRLPTTFPRARLHRLR